MLRVSNKACIRELSKKSFQASGTRNRIAILAIALTTMLFTTLFTVAMSMNTAFQESNFRQAGGYCHGTFKYMTEEQCLTLKDDSLIKEYGIRRVLGMGTGSAFRKNHVEVGYSDANNAHWMYLDPVEGRLPKEGTNEAATDIEVLRLLGVEPEIGIEFTIPIQVDDHETMQTFTLCGWWDKDPIITANHVLISESRLDSILEEIGIKPLENNELTGSWNMDVMFHNTRHIAENMNTILHHNGYQSDEPDKKGTYISFGVNWGYTDAQISAHTDPMMVLTIMVLLLLVIFTGYLIIYNIFQISVVSDIRFYGLLKTIGTTGRQMKSLLRRQAFVLWLLGTPIGLVIGWLVGAKLTPIILANLNDMPVDALSVNPLIFVGAAVFTLCTVFLSCARPGRMAAKVSPVEAVRYTEGTNSHKKQRKYHKNFSIFHMAWANLGRSKGKTFITVLSLTLAVLLMQITVTFTNGFDMDKYLERNSVSDFIVSDASYFQTGRQKSPVDKETLEAISKQEGISQGGYVYMQPISVMEFVTEAYYKQFYGKWEDAENLEKLLANADRNEEGLVMTAAQTYGMEPFALDCLEVVEGDISKLYEPNSRAIAAVYSDDDYGKLIPDSHWAKVGDTVTLRYIKEWEYVDLETGKVYQNPDDLGNHAYKARPVVYEDVDFTVAALVIVPHALSYRYYGSDEFVMNSETFQQLTGRDDILLYAFDTTKEANKDMESFLQKYTSDINPICDYESKASYEKEFNSFRSMFLLLGTVLSGMIGLVGILNFFNAILTGIITRKREFAMLQSIGMTGKQLKIMLVWEGLFYAFGSVLLALLASLAMTPLLSMTLSKVFWFFSYKQTFAPIFLVTPVFAFLGCVVPLLVYHSVSKQTIVERLRETEG